MLLRRFDVLLADDLHQALVIGLCGLFGGLFLGDHRFGGRLDIRGDLRVVGSCRAEVRVLDDSSEELEGGVGLEVLRIRDDVLTDGNRGGRDGVLQGALLIQSGLDEVGCQLGILGLGSNGEHPAT